MSKVSQMFKTDIPSLCKTLFAHSHYEFGLKLKRAKICIEIMFKSRYEKIHAKIHALPAQHDMFAMRVL